MSNPTKAELRRHVELLTTQLVDLMAASERVCKLATEPGLHRLANEVMVARNVLAEVKRS